MTHVMSMRDLGQAIETKYAMDQEVAFKIKQKANILVAEWAAERIGLDPEESQRFVIELSHWSLQPGNPDLKARLMADFGKNKIEISENALERLILLKSEQAKRNILNS